MKQYTLENLIETSQYFKTKPDQYIIKKGIQQAIRRLQKKTILTVIVSVLIGACVGVLGFYAWTSYFHTFFSF